MKISVIMVAYNSSKTIRGAIGSFILQNYKEKELIVIDGASTDGTTDIVQEYLSPGIKLFSERDNGIYDAMNKGLRIMKGDVFGFLNSDDRFHGPNSLELLVEGIKDHDLVSGTLHLVKTPGAKSPSRIWKPEAYKTNSFYNGYSLPHPTTYSKRHVYETVGEFSCDYSSAGDYHWFIRALEIHGFSHCTIDEVIVDMLVGGESTQGLRSLINNSRELLAVRRELLKSGPVDKALFLNFYLKLKQVQAFRLPGVLQKQP